MEDAPVVKAVSLGCIVVGGPKGVLDSIDASLATGPIRNQFPVVGLLNSYLDAQGLKDAEAVIRAALVERALTGTVEVYHAMKAKGRKYETFG